LVLGGGGARGFAHIGVLKILVNNDLPVDLVVGTSIGSIAGAFFCAGIPMSKVEEIAQNVTWTTISNASPVSLAGLLFTDKMLSTAAIEKFIDNNIGDITFDKLKIPLICVATDLNTGEKILLNDGKVAFAVRASATIPGFFEPVPYRQRNLIDGGLSDNIPVGIAKGFNPDIIIAVPVSADITKNNTSSVLLILL
jgi:NTE family protein